MKNMANDSTDFISVAKNWCSDLNNDIVVLKECGVFSNLILANMAMPEDHNETVMEDQLNKVAEVLYTFLPKSVALIYSVKLRESARSLWTLRELFDPKNVAHVDYIKDNMSYFESMTRAEELLAQACYILNSKALKSYDSYFMKRMSDDMADKILKGSDELLRISKELGRPGITKDLDALEKLAKANIAQAGYVKCLIHAQMEYLGRLWMIEDEKQPAGKTYADLTRSVEHARYLLNLVEKERRSGDGIVGEDENGRLRRDSDQHRRGRGTRGA